MSTAVEQMKTALEAQALPRRSIEVYGRQVVITCHCLATAERWAGLLRRFATIRKILRTIEDAPSVESTSERLHPVTDVWKVYARI